GGRLTRGARAVGQGGARAAHADGPPAGPVGGAHLGGNASGGGRGEWRGPLAPHFEHRVSGARPAGAGHGTRPCWGGLFDRFGLCEWFERTVGSAGSNGLRERRDRGLDSTKSGGGDNKRRSCRGRSSYLACLQAVTTRKSGLKYGL